MPTTLRLFDDEPRQAPRPATRPAHRALRTDASPEPARALSVVEQVRRAALVRNRLAMACGALLGAFVPTSVFTIVHAEDLQARPWLWLLVAGGLVFSATSVYGFGRSAFRSAVKAAGFTVLIEGVMVCTSVEWLAWVALALLVAVNAVVAGISLALEHEALHGARSRE